nr:DUF4396 domain-containing protein [Anaerolineales bacterium]
DQIQLITDLRRAIDLLITRPEVDPQRLAYLGVSYGGAMGGLLAGIEHRLVAYVLQVGDGGLVTHSTGLDDVGSSFQDLSVEEQVRWVEAMWPIEPIHYVSQAAPAELLFLNGTQDALVPPADALRYQSAGSDPKTILWYEAGHRLPLKAMRDQVAWLESRIGLVNLEEASVNLLVMEPVELGVLIVPEIRTSALLIDRLLLVWFLMSAASLAILLLDLGIKRKGPRAAVLMWSLTIVFFGPVGLLAYALAYRAAYRAVRPSSTRLWRRALGSTVWSVSAILTGGLIVIALMKANPAIGENIALVLSTLILPPLIIGAVIFRLMQLGSGDEEEPDFVVRRTWVAEFIATNATLAGSYPVVLLLIERWLEPWHGFVWNLATPALWGVLMLGAIAGGLTAYPFQVWMLQRELTLWGWKHLYVAETAEHKEGVRQARWFQIAGVAVLSFVGLIGLVWLTFTI